MTTPKIWLSQHSVRNLIGDEFTLANLKAKFQEIMSMNVTPSTNTNLLNVKFDWEGNMIDKTTGETVGGRFFWLGFQWG